MIEGIEILSVVDYTTGNIIFISLLSLMVILAITVIVLTIIYMIKYFEFNGIVAVVLIIVCIVGGLGIVGIIHTARHFNEKAYKVTISNEVSFKELTNKYEIIDQDGEIYTIRERR